LLFNLHNEKLEALLREKFKDPSAVESLDLFEYSLDVIPTLIREFSNLKTLSLYLQDMVRIPEWLPEFQNLENLCLLNIQTSTIPEPVLNCKNLKRLTISESSIGKIPSGIKNLQKLEEFSVTRTRSERFYRPSITLCREFYKLTSLKKISFENMHVNDLSKKISNFKNLQEINLSGSNVSDDDIKMIHKKLPGVKIIY
jgi:Leucine-rich repeat (LRR) protein